MKEFVISLLKNEAVMWILLSVVIFGLTQLLKMPIKHFTKRVEDAKIRKKINMVIYVIPFGLGFLFAWLYSTYLPKIGGLEDIFKPEYLLMGFKLGSSSIAMYGVVDQLFGIKLKNPYKTEDGKKILEIVEDITKDGKVTKGEIIEKTKALTKEEEEQINKILEGKQ